MLGKLGENLTLEQGYEAAHLIAINLISTLKASIGDLSKVKRIVRLTGMVNATSDFTDNSKVMMVVLTYLFKYLEKMENIRE